MLEVHQPFASIFTCAVEKKNLKNLAVGRDKD